MDLLILAALGLFLPLFPGSMLFNALAARAGGVTAPLLMLGWPLLGVGLWHGWAPELPPWVAWWAVGTAAFYAFRALAVNDVATWSGYLWVSAVALSWPLLVADAPSAPAATVLVLALPAALLRALGEHLRVRFGGAYLGLVGGLVHSMPRFSMLVVLVLLAVMGTPPFPAFFHQIGLLAGAPLPLAAAVLGVWYLWGWAGLRFLQRLVLGPQSRCPAPLSPGDLAAGAVGLYALVLAALALYGLRAAMGFAGGM